MGSCTVAMFRYNIHFYPTYNLKIRVFTVYRIRQTRTCTKKAERGHSVSFISPISTPERPSLLYSGWGNRRVIPVALQRDRGLWELDCYLALTKWKGMPPAMDSPREKTSTCSPISGRGFKTELENWTALPLNKAGTILSCLSMNSKGLKSVQYHKVKNAANHKNRERLFRYSFAKPIKNSRSKKIIIIIYKYKTKQTNKKKEKNT